MKRKITLFIAFAALSGTALVAAAFGASSASPLSVSKGAIVALRSTALGSVLVDTRGHTLYLFKKDKQGRSACYGACATYWPPLYSTTKARAGKGVHASLLGVTKRANGKTDFGGAWDVVSASGRAVEPSASDSGGSGGYGGGYGG